MYTGTLQRDLRKEPLNRRLPERIFARIHEDIAAAAMSWENPGEAGVFNAERSSIIAFNLCHFIADELEGNMNEFADVKNVPRHEVERRLREEFGPEAPGERGVAENFEAWVRETAKRWQRLVDFIDRFKAALETPDAGDGPAPPAG